MILMIGNELADAIKEGLSVEIASLDFVPKLVVIQVGDNEASSKYIKMKQKACEKVGIIFEHLRFEDDISESSINDKIFELNNDSSVTGIIVQLPLPKDIDKQNVIDAINPEKDVDGLTTANINRLGSNLPCQFPATAEGIINLLRYYNISMKGANAVVIGRSNLVGKPVAHMLQAEGAEVTICHSKTADIASVTLEADIIISAVGKKDILTADMVKEGVAVVDVGMDVDFDNVSKIAGYITPPIGGVGPMTVAMLLSNVVKAAKMQKEM